VYIDYVESAPWNIKKLMTALGQPQRFRAVGTRLFEAAVLQSQEEGFRGGLACILFLVRKAFTSTGAA